MRADQAGAIVTGAASGLGAATARRLAEAGATVFGLDLARAIDGAPEVPGVEYVASDVTDADQVAAAVAHAGAGPVPLRIVVNCAGIAPSARVVGRSGRHRPEVFRSTVEVNLIGTFLVMSTAAEHLARVEPVDADGQRGVIVNTASIAAFDGQIGQVAYAASKGGIVSMTLPAARDLASTGIRVCAIAPGIVDTALLASFGDEVRANLAAGVPFPARLARPEEYAQLVLAVVEHDYLNGEVVRMDGALRMPPR